MFEKTFSQRMLNLSETDSSVSVKSKPFRRSSARGGGATEMEENKCRKTQSDGQPYQSS